MSNDNRKQHSTALLFPVCTPSIGSFKPCSGRNYQCKRECEIMIPSPSEVGDSELDYDILG